MNSEPDRLTAPSYLQEGGSVQQGANQRLLTLRAYECLRAVPKSNITVPPLNGTSERVTKSYYKSLNCIDNIGIGLMCKNAQMVIAHIAMSPATKEPRLNLGFLPSKGDADDNPDWHRRGDLHGLLCAFHSLSNSMSSDGRRTRVHHRSAAASRK